MVIEGTHYSPNCSCKNCKRIKVMDKKASLQKESEWGENIKEVADELWELLPPNFFYRGVNRKTMYNWIRTRLENVLYNREKEIAEEVKKKIKSAGGLGGLKHLDDILNETILKH